MKLSHIFKVILLLLLPFFVLAQYPNNPIKSRLGWQTTGDGLIYRGAGAPTYSPGTLFNAWMYLDTTNYALYMYRNFQWTKLPLVNNGLTLDGSYVQLGGTLVENTTVERSTYTLDFGKISGSNNGYLSFYGTDPHYVGILTTKDGTESGLTIGNKTWGFEVDDSDHVSTLTGTRFGFDATYLGTLGVSQFKMDSTRFYIRGLPTYATHAAADADLDTYGMYQITDGRAIYSRTGSADKVSPNIQDNGTAVSILSSKPFQLGQWTTAGRPSGTAGYMGWRDGTTFEWYNGTRWAAGLESTFARGTAGRIPFFDANGQITDNSGLAWDNTNKYLAINKSSPTYHLEIQSFGTINQRWIGLYNSAGFQQASFDSDGSGNGAVYVYNNVGVIQGRFASGDVSFLTGKIAFGTQTIGLSDFLVLKRQSDFGINALLAVGQSGSGYPGLGYNVLFTSSTSSFTRRYNYDPSYYIDLGTAGRFSIKTAPTGATGSSITFTENFSIVQSTGNVGIAQTSPQRRLDVNGEVRIADLTTDTPTRFVGADADGDLGAISFNSIWRDYQTDKAILGSDSSFVHDPAVDSTRILGTLVVGKPSTLGNPTTAGHPFIFRNPSAASTYMLIESGRTSPTGGGAGLRLLASGQFGGEISFGTSTSSELSFYSYFAGRSLFNVGLSNFVTGNKNTTLVGTIQDPIQWDFNARFVVYDTITSGKALAVFKKVASSSTPIAMFSSVNNDRFTFNDDGTTRFHVYGTPATTAAALSKTLTNYGVGFATDGTVTSREIKRDTTIYVIDADYDFSAALTTAQVASRYNRVIFLMTTTAAAGSNSDLTLHAPDVNLMQVEYLVRSTDETGGFTNTIQFGANNAVDSGNTLVSSYTPSPGQGVGIRAGLRSGVYEYFYY